VHFSSLDENEFGNICIILSKPAQHLFAGSFTPGFANEEDPILGKIDLPL